MSLHAGLFAIAVGLLPDLPLRSEAWELFVWSVIYGAVMLYGTAPLPRKEAR